MGEWQCFGASKHCSRHILNITIIPHTGNSDTKTVHYFVVFTPTVDDLIGHQPGRPPVRDIVAILFELLIYGEKIAACQWVCAIHVITEAVLEKLSTLSENVTRNSLNAIRMQGCWSRLCELVNSNIEGYPCMAILDGSIEESFITFVIDCGHSANKMIEFLIAVLLTMNIIANCYIGTVCCLNPKDWRKKISPSSSQNDVSSVSDGKRSSLNSGETKSMKQVVQQTEPATVSVKLPPDRCRSVCSRRRDSRANESGRRKNQTLNVPVQKSGCISPISRSATRIYNVSTSSKIGTYLGATNVEANNDRKMSGDAELGKQLQNDSSETPICDLTIRNETNQTPDESRTVSIRTTKEGIVISIKLSGPENGVVASQTKDEGSFCECPLVKSFNNFLGTFKDCFVKLRESQEALRDPPPRVRVTDHSRTLNNSRNETSYMKLPRNAGRSVCNK
ncbi:hypothetical protein WN51_02993 [Melipona quadrifasciata]|uniref:Uncharacterized protein n=1 Tax=Melipona quadrifasciata TaxID=166423 RepID=A0A0N0BEL9_9HYME|nr:hypothetical protein WN51_02993 [Melipona quadrifasciata]